MAALPRVRHCARNCGQVSPPVVPAAWACFHWLAQIAMTLSAFAAVGPAQTPKAIAAAVSKGTSEWRIDIPTQFEARKGLCRQPTATKAVSPSRIPVLDWMSR